MAVIKVTTDSFENEVLKSDKPVLVDFNATWCGPCKMLKPVIDEISEERSDIKVAAIDVDDEGELAAQFGVFSIPCMVVFKNGEEVSRAVGFRPKEDILELLNEG